MSTFWKEVKSATGWDYMRGDVIIVDLGDSAGSEKRGRRPAVILQSDDIEPRPSHSTIAPMTTKSGADLSGYEPRSTEVVLPAGAGELRETSIVECQHIREISLEHRVVKPLGWLDNGYMADIDAAAMCSLGLSHQR